MIVQLIDGSVNQEYWFVSVLLDDGKTGSEGLVPNTFLELLDEHQKEEAQEKHKSLEHLE